MQEEVSFKTYPKIYSFLKQRGILSISPLESKWRKENTILRVDCEQGSYVFKRISSKDKIDEIARIKLLKSHYPSLLTDIHVYEGNAYLMTFIDGKNFFELPRDEKIGKINLAGQILANCWNGQYFATQDIRERIRASFEKYRKKSARFFSEHELWLQDFSQFSAVPAQPSHNDLNAANILYDSGIKIIDPSNEGYEDIARDVGRYLASCFFNNYDYFSQDKKHSLDVAFAFLCNFSPELLERARFYLGESFLSFLNFPTISTPKEVLKRLAINTLEKSKPILKSLEESL